MKREKEAEMETWVKHSVALSVAAAILLGIAAGPLFGLTSSGPEVLLGGVLMGVVFVYPLVLTAANIIFLFCENHSPLLLGKGRVFEGITLVVGILYSLLALPIANITIADWTRQLSNRQLHTPIWTQGFLTVGMLAAAGLAGYLVLSLGRLSKMPPLIPVCAMAAMYLGIAQCALWIVQVFAMGWRFWLCLLPLNCILISLKVIRQKVNEWNLPDAGPASGSPQISSAPQNHGPLEGSKKEGTITPSPAKFFSHPFLQRLNLWLSRSSRWPAAALLFALPLLGIAVALLVLFGQQPDSLAKAWTETSG